MTIIMTRADKAPRFQLPGLEFTGLASPSRGSADLCTWRLTIEHDMAATEPHFLDRDEIFMVVSGTIRLSPDAEAISAGDVAVVPSGAPIQLANVGDGVAEVIVAIPAGFIPTAADGSEIGTPPWAL
jgi:mannose-6-phosphate isomerase-like protein (cupin superfamily)